MHVFPSRKGRELEVAMSDAPMEFDLPAAIERLRGAPTGSSGQGATTLVKYDDLRVVLIALAAPATR